MNVVPATADQIPRGEAVLLEGGVVVIPTDTVYGIAARIDVQSAVDRLFEIKGRDRQMPMAVLVSDINMAKGLAVITEEAKQAAEDGWPGPLTLVLPRTDEAKNFDLGGDAETIGLRVPDHAFALELIGRAGPLVATSANPSGRPEAVNISEMEELSGVALFFDAGPVEGKPSKVVSFVDGKKTLRD